MKPTKCQRFTANKSRRHRAAISVLRVLPHALKKGDDVQGLIDAHPRLTSDRLKLLFDWFANGGCQLLGLPPNSKFLVEHLAWLSFDDLAALFGKRERVPHAIQRILTEAGVLLRAESTIGARGMRDPGGALAQQARWKEMERVRAMPVRDVPIAHEHAPVTLSNRALNRLREWFTGGGRELLGVEESREMTFGDLMRLTRENLAGIRGLGRKTAFWTERDMQEAGIPLAEREELRPFDMRDPAAALRRRQAEALSKTAAAGIAAARDEKRRQAMTTDQWLSESKAA